MQRQAESVRITTNTSGTFNSGALHSRVTTRTQFTAAGFGPAKVSATVLVGNDSDGKRDFAGRIRHDDDRCSRDGYAREHGNSQPCRAS